jgi:cytochrome c peroxidase
LSKHFSRKLLFPVTLLIAGSALRFEQSATAGSGIQLPNLLPLPNASGFAATFSQGAIHLDNAFFQSLGTNGRSCASCHLPTEGWSISAENVRLRFYATLGTDPIFRTNDGSNCNTSNVSSFAAKQQAYSLLLRKGLIRVELPVPTGAEFAVTTIVNPYGCGNTANVSVYRRPLPTANLRFLSTVMWDGRESQTGNTLRQNLLQQALDATTGHAQGSGLSTANQQAIVDFEMALTTAQLSDFRAGRLDDDGATGGPQKLSQQDFFIGINDPLGGNPTNAPFDPSAMRMFKSWANARGWQSEARKSIARGEVLFNTKPIPITGVGGLNDALNAPVIPGTCTTCHDAPNVGNHSVSLAINIGVSDVSRPENADLPVFTLENLTTHQTVTTTDPGRALITGKWRDIGKTKGPVLRGLASRAPYFHNGSAATLLDAVEFYNTRFTLGLSAQEKTDLVNFLSVL